MTTEPVCQAKKRYPSKKIAKKVLRKLLSKGRTLSEYRCNVCDGYHLTCKKKMAYVMRVRENNHPLKDTDL